MFVKVEVYANGESLGEITETIVGQIPSVGERFSIGSFPTSRDAIERSIDENTNLSDSNKEALKNVLEYDISDNLQIKILEDTLPKLAVYNDELIIIGDLYLSEDYLLSKIISNNLSIENILGDLEVTPTKEELEEKANEFAVTIREVQKTLDKPGEARKEVVAVLSETFKVDIPYAEKLYDKVTSIVANKIPGYREITSAATGLRTLNDTVVVFGSDNPSIGDLMFSVLKVIGILNPHVRLFVKAIEFLDIVNTTLVEVSPAAAPAGDGGD